MDLFLYFLAVGRDVDYKKKSLARINFATITKRITKTIVTLNDFVIVLAGMVSRQLPYPPERQKLTPINLVGAASFISELFGGLMTS